MMNWNGLQKIEDPIHSTVYSFKLRKETLCSKKIQNLYFIHKVLMKYNFKELFQFYKKFSIKIYTKMI